MRAYLYIATDASDATYFVSHQLDVLLDAIEGVHDYIARIRATMAYQAALAAPVPFDIPADLGCKPSSRPSSRQSRWIRSNEARPA